MNELKNTISQIVACSIQKIIISKPQEKSNPYKKIVIERKKEYFQAAKYIEKQVFHDNVEQKDLYGEANITAEHVQNNRSVRLRMRTCR